MQLRRASPTIFELKDQPGCFWLFSMFFLGIGSLVLAGLLGLFNLDEVSVVGKIFTWALALSAISAGAFLLHRSPSSRARFDLQQGKLLISRRGLFRLENAEFCLDQIEDITLAETSDIDGDPVHQLRIQLRSGEVVPLSLLWLHNKEQLEKVREEILHLLRQQGFQP